MLIAERAERAKLRTVAGIIPKLHKKPRTEADERRSSTQQGGDQRSRLKTGFVGTF